MDFQPIEQARRLDTDYRDDCKRLPAVDEPWFGYVELRSAEGKLVRHKIGRVTHREPAILTFHHPFAAAYYDAEPGDAFEPDDARWPDYGAKVVVARARVAAQAREIQRVELRRTDG